MEVLLPIIFAVSLPWCPAPESAVAAIAVHPARPLQGDPVMVTIKGIGADRIEKISLDKAPLSLFPYDGNAIALYPVDLVHPAGAVTLAIDFKDGSRLTRSIEIQKRKVAEISLGIPQKLGGNTPQSQQKLIVSLASENSSLASVKSESRALWSAPFRAPLISSVVTDTFGYSRRSGAYSVLHKGVDFRAATGTPVLAMNDGIVRLAGEYRIYGKTVVVDHGLGLSTLYMHLSQITVAEGVKIARGEELGRSGDSGYAEYPHLHVSVRINSISIDPITFLNFFTPEFLSRQ